MCRAGLFRRFRCGFTEAAAEVYKRLFWKVSLRMQVLQLLRQFFESNSCFEECRNWILELCESWQLNLRKVLEYGCFKWMQRSGFLKSSSSVRQAFTG